jgi:cell division protein FtsI (penicillin-binding protein 3)
LIGFVGEEHRGLDGVEFMLDRVLRGTDGMLSCLRDARRRAVWINRDGYDPADNGHDVRLSIDLTIQTIAERALAEAVLEFQAEAGELVVMDARNGQLLALANYPFFDPADAGQVAAEARRNRCVTDPYEPGSIFKPIVWSAITQAGLADVAEKIDCTEAGFYVTAGGRRLHDSHGHGQLTWKGVLVKSSNIGMAIAGLRMDAARMHAAVGAFGFGQVTGSGMPGESVGIVNPVNRWNHYSLTSVPMGQEIAVTPLQMVRAFSAFANGGLMATPSFLAAEADFPIYQRAINADTADLTRQVLRQVVTDGTGRRAHSDQYTIWGKTGTAQVPDRINGGYIDRTYTGSFVCGAPLRQPRIIVMAVIHRPDPKIGYYGGTVAGPACKRVVEQTLAYLGVPADNSEAPDAQRVVLAD